MDWSTVALSVTTAAVSGGLIGGLVSLIVSKRESGDRQAALALEREKWETERSDRQAKEASEQTRAGRRELIAACEDIFDFVGDINSWSHPDRKADLEGETTRVYRLNFLLGKYGSPRLYRAVAKYMEVATAASDGKNPYALPRDEARVAIDDFMLAQQNFIGALEHFRLHVND